jgi:hypothetical protein
MPRHGVAIESLLPPLDRRRLGTSAWINDLTLPPVTGILQGTAPAEVGTSHQTPAGRR